MFMTILWHYTLDVYVYFGMHRKKGSVPKSWHQLSGCTVFKHRVARNLGKTRLKMIGIP